MYNLKNVKITHGGAKACNFTKSNTPPWVFFKYFKLCKWYQIAQHIAYIFLHSSDRPPNVLIETGEAKEVKYSLVRDWKVVLFFLPSWHFINTKCKLGLYLRNWILKILQVTKIGTNEIKYLSCNFILYSCSGLNFFKKVVFK